MKTTPWIAIAVAAALWPVILLQAEDKPEPRREHHQMTEEQRAQAEQRANEVWQKLSVPEKLALLKLSRALREMPAEDRKFIHERVERFLTMAPEERGKLKQNHEQWKKMTPEEREQARQQFQKRRKEFEEKWRKEHPGQEPPPFPPRGRKNPSTNEPSAKPAPVNASQP